MPTHRYPLANSKRIALNFYMLGTGWLAFDKFRKPRKSRLSNANFRPSTANITTYSVTLRRWHRHQVVLRLGVRARLGSVSEWPISQRNLMSYLVSDPDQGLPGFYPAPMTGVVRWFSDPSVCSRPQRFPCARCNGQSATATHLG